jgi:hypothetical protein
MICLQKLLGEVMEEFDSVKANPVSKLAKDPEVECVFQELEQDEKREFGDIQKAVNQRKQHRP